MNRAFFPVFQYRGFGLLGGFCESVLALFPWFFFFCLVLGFLFACWFGVFLVFGVFFLCFMGLGVVVGWVWGIFCLVVFRNSGKRQYILLKF